MSETERLFLLKNDELAEHIIQHDHHHVGEHLHRHAPQGLGIVEAGDKDGRRAVGTADDGDGGRAVGDGGSGRCAAGGHVQHRIRAKPASQQAQRTVHKALHQSRPLGGQQVAEDHHDGGVQYQCTQTAGDECTKFFQCFPALRPAGEDERPVGDVGEQNADDIVQHIAPAVGGFVAEQAAEQRIQYDVQQCGQHTENEISQHLAVLYKPVFHNCTKTAPPPFSRQRGCSSHCV